MTAAQICEKYGCSLSALEHNFKRTAAAILKKFNVRIVKNKKEYIVIENDMRALMITEESKEIFYFGDETMELADWEFVIFLALIVTPMLVFRGSYDEMLSYVNLPVTKVNREKVKEALGALASREYIMYNIDKTDENYFVAAIYRAIEQEFESGVFMIRQCKKLTEGTRKSWVPLLKTWLAIQFLVKEIEDNKRDSYTGKDIQEITGLSQYSIRESIKLLSNNEIFKRKFLYDDNGWKIGQTATLNGFYN